MTTMGPNSPFRCFKRACFQQVICSYIRKRIEAGLPVIVAAFNQRDQNTYKSIQKAIEGQKIRDFRDRYQCAFESKKNKKPRAKEEQKKKSSQNQTQKLRSNSVS